MLDWLMKRFDQREKCSVDPTQKCPISYTWDRNGALVVDRRTFNCCKYQRQFEAARRLSKLLKLKNYD